MGVENKFYLKDWCSSTSQNWSHSSAHCHGLYTANYFNVSSLKRVF